MVEIVEPSFEIEPFDSTAMMKRIEEDGRICYQSKHKITPDSYSKFIRMIIGRGHESVLEHEKITVRVVCDRGVTHEIVRHRLGAYSQESTRYCNYSQGRFGGSIKVIDPVQYMDELPRNVWLQAMIEAEEAYLALIGMGVKPQMARSVLPNSLKTEIVITYNLRQWRHFFRLRTAKAAHPQMREITVPMLDEFKKLLPPVFEDIEVK